MGVVVHDELTMPSGLKITNAYAGFSMNLISVTPVDDPASPTGKAYLIQAPYNIWVSDDTRRAGKDPLTVEQLSFRMGPEALTQGVYGLLYGQLCSRWTSYTNTDRQPAATQPAQSQTTNTADQGQASTSESQAPAEQSQTSDAGGQPAAEQNQTASQEPGSS